MSVVYILVLDAATSVIANYIVLEVSYIILAEDILLCLKYINKIEFSGQGTTLQTDRSWARFPMVSLEFFSDIILPVALWPWVDSASNRNYYQVYFLGVKVAGA